MQGYEVLYSLGSGSFGSVVAALDPHGNEVAIKKIRTYKIKDWVQKDEEVVPLEVACLQRLHGVTGIPKLIDYFEDEDFCFIVMERPSGVADLQQLIAENGAFPEEAAKEIFRQLLSILWNIREAGIVHRDIKPENVLVNPYTLDTYLVDFGLATPVTDAPFKGIRGTMVYVPPECLKGDEYYGDEAEAWSLGVLLFDMITGTHLFRTVAEVLLKAIELPKHASRNFKRLARQLLMRNPLNRIVLDQIMVSPWVKS